MANWRRTERLVRSRILGSPFVAANLLTRFEIFGRENLLAALARRHDSGRGLITISNHQSLFDDPLVHMALLGIEKFTVESKCWWSSPCQANFNPRGKSLGARFTRYFSDVSNMVFFARRHKQGGRIPLPERYLEELGHRGGRELVERVEARAMSLGVDGETYLRTFLTPGDPAALDAINQAAMVEACARINTGDWMHFFPEGGRSRNLDLRTPKRGVGKVIYHCPDADVIPICFCGMHDVMPVGARLPRPLKRVAVFVGRPVPRRYLDALRRQPPSLATFDGVTKVAWASVAAMWPDALARYFDPNARVASTHRNTEAWIEAPEVPAPAQRQLRRVPRRRRRANQPAA